MKLNIILLEDPKCIVGVKEIIGFTTEHNKLANHSLMWDTVEDQTQWFSIKFAPTKKKKREQRLKELKSNVSTLMQELESNSLNENVIAHL